MGSTPPLYYGFNDLLSDLTLEELGDLQRHVDILKYALIELTYAITDRQPWECDRFFLLKTDFSKYIFFIAASDIDDSSLCLG